MTTPAGPNAPPPDDLGQQDPDQYLRVLTASVPVLLAYLDAEWRYRAANDAYATWFGRTPEDIIGRHLREVVGEADYQVIRPFITAALGGVPVTYDRPMTYAAGDDRFVHVSLTPHVEGGAVRGLSAALTDITERRRAEEQARQAQEQTALVIAGARCLLWSAVVWDRGESWLHWETRLADEDALRGFGIAVPPGGDAAAAWHRSRLPDDRAANDLNALRAVRAGEDYSQEFRCRRADGGVFWMKEDVRVRPVAPGQWRLIGVSTDITERKEAEARLARSEAYLRLAVEGAGVGIWRWDRRTGERLWTPKSKALFGLDPDADVTEERLQAALHPEDRPRWRDLMQTRAGEADYDQEYRAVWPDGSVHWLQAKGQAEYDENGELVRMEGVLLDIGERKRLEAGLAAAARDQKHIAEVLQMSLLAEPHAQDSERLSVQTLYQPAAEQMLIGGDFFDRLVLPDGRVALVVGDMVGKGLAAATSMAEVKYALRAYLSESPAPARTLARLNDFLLDGDAATPPRLGLVSLALAMIDPDTGETVCAAAAAEPPLIVRAGGGAEVVSVGGLPLGADAGAAYTEARARLAPGDLLLLTTDGLTEARRGGAFFGREGVVAAAQAALPLGSTDAVARSVLETARAFAGGRFQDDVCLLVASRR